MKINFTRRSSRILLASLFILLNSLSPLRAQCAPVDQSQLTYNGGMSARNLAQYSEWQSFTPGTTGTLCQIDMGFFNTMTGTGTLNIFAGTGTGGTLLQTQLDTVSGTGNFFKSFYVNVPVTAGSVYTFQFVPTQGGGLPDPYGVQIESPGTYSGGQMETTDPSGTYVTGFDEVFKTYVSLSTGLGPEKQTSDIMSVYPNPFTVETTLKVGKPVDKAVLIVYNVLGERVFELSELNGTEFKINRKTLTKGMYFISLEENGRVIGKTRMLVTD